MEMHSEELDLFQGLVPISLYMTDLKNACNEVFWESQWLENSTGLKSECEEMTVVEIMIQSRILKRGRK